MEAEVVVVAGKMAAAVRGLLRRHGQLESQWESVLRRRKRAGSKETVPMCAERSTSDFDTNPLQ